MYMRIYHGREDVNQQMTEWGFNGPALYDITKACYQAGNLVLVFDGDVASNQAQKKVDWPAINWPWMGEVLPIMNVVFARPLNFPEFVRINYPQKPSLFF